MDFRRITIHKLFTDQTYLDAKNSASRVYALHMEVSGFVIVKQRSGATL